MRSFIVLGTALVIALYCLLIAVLDKQQTAETRSRWVRGSLCGTVVILLLLVVKAWQSMLTAT